MKTKHSLLKIVAVFLSIAGFGISMSSVTYAQPAFNVQKAIAAGDHKGLAEYYQSQADAQRKIAAMHDDMKVAYRNTYVHYKGTENVLAGHCGNLKLQALKMADQYDALAAQEEKLAATQETKKGK